MRATSAVAIAVVTLGMLTAPASTAAGTADGLIMVSDFATGEIYTVSPDGSHFRQLTHGAPNIASFTPSWGPNGGQIVFDRGINGRDRIYIMAADGSRMRRVRGDARAYNDDAPSFFPGGARIAFARCRSDFSGCVIATMRRDGTDLHTLTHARHEVYDSRPAVSPDGRHIVFSRGNADGVTNRIWVMRRNGSHAHPISAARYEAYGPDWAPGGKGLMFSSNCCRLGGNVFTSDLAGSAVHMITHTPWPLANENGVFSPTGTRVAMASDRRHANRCCFDLFTLPVRGGPVTRVPLPINHIDKVDWAPRRP